MVSARKSASTCPLMSHRGLNRNPNSASLIDHLASRLEWSGFSNTWCRGWSVSTVTELITVRVKVWLDQLPTDLVRVPTSLTFESPLGHCRSVCDDLTGPRDLLCLFWTSPWENCPATGPDLRVKSPSVNSTIFGPG